MSSFPLSSAGYDVLNIDCFVEEILKLVESALFICSLGMWFTRPECRSDVRHVARTVTSRQIDQRTDCIPGQLIIDKRSVHQAPKVSISILQSSLYTANRIMFRII